MPMTPEEVIEVRKLAYEEYQKRKQHAYQLSADYGRWLIASLLLVHGAAVAFLAQNDRLSQTVLPTLFWWHVAGLLLAFLCGFLVWSNWSLHALAYDPVNPGMIFDDDHWPDFSSKRIVSLINLTHWLGILAGLISAACIFLSAKSAYNIMSAT